MSLLPFPSKTCRRFVLSALALTFSAVSWADNSGTATVSSGGNFSFDSGSTVSSGGDISFTGTAINYVGTAVGQNLSTFVSAEYGSFTQVAIQAESSGFTNQAITGLATSLVFLIKTNGGNYGKAMITSVSGSSITFQYATYGNTTTGGGGGGGPTITLVQNNYSFLLPGLPSYGIAPGSIFTIIGTGMSGPQGATLQSSAAPGIPQLLDQTSVSVTVNGQTFTPGLYYVTATAIAGVLPSAATVGDGTITVTYNGQKSNAAPLHVVANALGLDTLYSTGSGIGVATDNNTGAVFTYTNSVKPGGLIVLWGTGLGADTADSDLVTTATPHAVNTSLQIYIGGVQATIVYAGSSGYPGLDQIDVTVPVNVPTGCAISVVGVIQNTTSNTITIPIDPSGANCNDTGLGISGSQLLGLGGKANINDGVLAVFYGTSPGSPEAGEATGLFFRQPGTESGSSYGVASLGSCIVEQSSTSTIKSPFTETGLDAGTITVTGPGGTQPLAGVSSFGGGGPSGIYAYAPQTNNSAFFPLAGGTFTINGAGGTDIGAFSASISISNPLVWVNQVADATVNRTQGVTVNWTGGQPGTYVNIHGISGGANGTASFTCNAPVGPGSFQVPNYITLQLPSGTGTLSVENSTTFTLFTAAGLDYGLAFGGISDTINVTYQ